MVWVYLDGVEKSFSLFSGDDSFVLALDYPHARFSAAGPDGTRGYARVNVAKNMVNDPSKVKVYVDGAERSFKMSSADDSWLLAFDYTHSTHQVIVDLDITIVPEFPGLIVIPLVMMATLLVTMLSRKRRLL